MLNKRVAIVLFAVLTVAAAYQLLTPPAYAPPCPIDEDCGGTAKICLGGASCNSCGQTCGSGGTTGGCTCKYILFNG